MMFNDLLAPIGINVLRAMTVQGSNALIESERPDIVVIGSGPHAAPGLDALRALRAMPPPLRDTPVILVAWSGEDPEANALADTVLARPIRPHTVAQAVRPFLDSDLAAKLNDLMESR